MPEYIKHECRIPVYERLNELKEKSRRIQGSWVDVCKALFITRIGGKPGELSIELEFVFEDDEKDNGAPFVMYFEEQQLRTADLGSIVLRAYKELWLQRVREKGKHQHGRPKTFQGDNTEGPTPCGV